MFLRPVLQVLHAVLSGLSLAVCTKPLLLIPVGLVFGIVYYVVFRAAIRALNLPTPGHLDEEGADLSPAELRGTTTVADR